jgi:hypothetical protein
MIRSRFILTFAATATLLVVATQSSPAQTNQFGTQTNVFPALFHAVCISTNTNGIVTVNFGNSNLIHQCLRDLNLTNLNTTNLSTLRLVYNRTNDSLQVIGATNQFSTNQSVICTLLSFDNGVSFTNTNNTVAQFFSFVFVGTNQVSSGCLVGKQTLTFGSSNQLTGFRLVADLAYTVAASGTNPAALYRGVLVAGSGRLNGKGDEFDEEDEDGGRRGPPPWSNFKNGVGNPWNNGNNNNPGHNGNNGNNGNKGNH